MLEEEDVLLDVGVGVCVLEGVDDGVFVAEGVCVPDRVEVIVDDSVGSVVVVY